ncbi:MAG: hypothetical protein ACQEWE_18880 [Bacillota bacterium]
MSAGNNREHSFIDEFNGYKFLDFIDVDKFKSDSNLQFEIPEEKLDLDFSEFYSFLREEFPQQKVGKLFFENIFYSHLKNIFVSKISGHPNLGVDFFRKKVKHLISEVNSKEVIPGNYYKHMNENGFYLMEVLNIGIPNTSFIAGLDYTEYNGKVTNARFLFVEVLPKSTQGVAYFIAGIEFDFEKNLALTMIKNVTGLKKESTTIATLPEKDTEKDIDTTIHQLHRKVIDKVFSTLGVSVEAPVVKDDRSGMYKFCKYLDDNLLEDVRKEVSSRTDNAVKDSVTNLNRFLFPGTDSLTTTDKADLRKKIQALLLSYYIDYKIKPTDLVRKAKTKKLAGYPTRIKFTSSRSSRSSTQSTNSKHPVSSSDMFHSLYFNFEQALGLDNWSISWFTDYSFKNDKDIDVIQTTIYSTKKSFKVVFLPNRPLYKEIIHYVIGTISSYR